MPTRRSMRTRASPQLRKRLDPGGTLTIWSATEARGFANILRRVFEKVEASSVPLRRGEPDVVYVASR